MTWQNNLLQNLLTIFILVSLVLVVYLKAKGITLIEFIRSIREAMGSGTEAITESVEGGFNNIR